MRRPHDRERRAPAADDGDRADARPVGAEQIPRRAEDGRQEEAAEPAGRADDPGQHRRSARRSAARRAGRRRRCRPRTSPITSGERDRRGAERGQRGREQQQRRADRRRRRSAPSCRRRGRRGSRRAGAAASRARAPPATIVAASTFEIPYWSWKKIGRKLARPTKRAERHRVQARTGARRRPRAARRAGRATRTGRAGARRLLGQQRERDPHEHHRDQRQPEDRVPADVLGDPRRGQRRQHRARVAGAGDPHRQALMPRRVVAAGERQRDREARAGDAEQHADAEQLRRSCRAPSQPASSATTTTPIETSPTRRGP